MAADDQAGAVQLDNVRRSFRAGKRVVDAVAGITATVPRGQVTGLIGPDGAGKTTLMRLVAGLLKLDAGDIEVLGMDVTADPLSVQARLGYMPQHFGLYEDLSVRENLDLYADLQGVPRRERQARYDELLHMTGLGPFTTRMAGRLSGGMKQKLGLACTLVHPPELLLLDEPTVGVDPVSRRELWEIIERLTSEARTTVLFSTAYLDEAERCNTVLLLYEGKLLGSGSPDTFTAEVSGRTFTATADLGRRRLQAVLADRAGVLDAVIQGKGVRLVTETRGEPGESVIGQALPGFTMEPVAPRFEDSFVARLRLEQARAVSAPQTDATASRVSPDTEGRSDAEAGPVIEVKNLTRRFGPFVAVNQISFNVGRGEIFGLLGANGAGKSTTFRMLCGLLPPSGGSLSVAGFDLRTAAAPARGRIGYMAQRFSLYADLSVGQNLRFFSSAYRLTGTRQKARIGWATTEFNLADMVEVTARDLPLGFKQRLALACALMHEPEILFLDEPTSGVDPLARREFWRRINALAESGVTVLVTTHFMEEAEYCDRLAIMAQGHILTEGTPEAIKDAARGGERPNPTMEDAFIAVIQASVGPEAA